MARLKKNQTNFTGGWVDPGVVGRADLRAYANGAARLENVFVKPLGGVKRRDGMVFVDEIAGTGRLIAFEFNVEQVYLLVFTDLLMTVYKDDVEVATLVVPYTEAQLSQIAWTQSADTLLIAHPDVAPKKITRTSDADWSISEWVFESNDDGRIYQPHGDFTLLPTELDPAATTGSGVAVVASEDYFVAGHVGLQFFIQNKAVEIASVVDAKNATVDIKETLPNANATEDWSEQAFSAVRGWPTTVGFHQKRLVIGGSRDLPNQLWFSKTSAFFDFDLGSGEDDEAIDVPILADQVNAIRAVFSGRDLQVFTSGAEWRVSDVTPGSLKISRQTRLGSPIDRHIHPVDIDGATIFIPRLDPRPREFLFTDLEQAYSVTDLALLSRDLLNAPTRMAYDQDDRFLHVVNGDGTIATLTIYRAEQVAAWSKQTTDGLVEDAETLGGTIYLMVYRNGQYNLEKFAASYTDGAVIATGASSDTWAGLDHLEGKTVTVLADGAVQPSVVVSGGQVVIDEAATSVEIGLPFTHYIDPLPFQVLAEKDANVGMRLRPVATRMKLLNTKALSLNTGAGVLDRSFQTLGDDLLDDPLPSFTGEVTYRQYGWRNTNDAPLWQIEQAAPLPFHLILVISEVALND